MKRLTQTLPVFLAAALQLMPLVRNLFINPVTGNSFAFILRWGIGTGAALGTVDAVSGASGTYLSSSSSLVGTNSIPMTNYLTFVINGGNVADTLSDYFVLFTKTNNTGTASSLLLNNNFTNLAMPAGLIFTCLVTNGASTITGRISGTPASTGVTNITVMAGYVGGYTYSTNISITIIANSGTAPVITNQPVSLTNNVSSNAAFTVTAGTAPLHYQWYFNTNTALLNATNTSLTLTNIQLTNTGNYRVIITNSSGSVTSSFATLTVWQPPIIANDLLSLTNLVSSNATLTINASGTPALKYQWYFNTNTSLLNATNTSLTLTNLQLTNAGIYSVILTNSAGSVTSSFAKLTVWQPPVITNAPVGFTSVAGGSGSLGVIAGGFPALAYQWRITTNLITSSLASGTNASLNFTNLRACQAGAYTIILTNSAGSVTSSIANLVVTNPAPPVAGGSFQGGTKFQFTFTPIAGLTNTVLTNGLLAGGTWDVFTNYPPTATPIPITISNNPTAPSLFYRLLIVP